MGCPTLTYVKPLFKERVKFHILKADADFAVGSVWANHCDSAESLMLGGLNELKDFVVS